jgi:hypothetical protein
MTEDIHALHNIQTRYPSQELTTHPRLRPQSLEGYNMPSILWICPLFLKQKYVVTTSDVYCSVLHWYHFTFSHVSKIYQINVQQHAAFVTFSHVILFTQKNENQTFTVSTTPFPNFDKAVFRLIEIDVGTKCPGVTDTYSIYTKFIIV